ncbi:MAG: M24 family metallopeptidase [Dehalococcoidia bacterium]|nr:M24 family metallopeptidase [Dehalococcoidia bacterium]
MLGPDRRLRLPRLHRRARPAGRPPERRRDAVSSARLDRLRARFEALRVDALLVTTPSNRRWLSGFTGSSGVLLVDRDRALFATDSRYWEQAGRQAPEFTLVKIAGASTASAPALLEGLGGRRLGYEPAGLTVAAFDDWRRVVEALPPAARPELVAAPRAIERLRMVKESAEIEALARAVRLGDDAFRHAAAVAAPGMTERQLAWEVQRYAMEHGADDLSFATIIAGGPWSAMPHAYPRDEPLRAGQGVVMDLGVRLDGYCSDLTRTISLGEPDAQFRRVYDIVLTAQTMAEERIEAGMTGRQAHEIAVAVIAQAGHADHFGHGLGHGVGLDIHEDPRLSPAGEDVLEDGNVVTVEPGIYLPGWGGVRIEDQCVMEHGRLRSLTTATKLDLVRA